VNTAAVHNSSAVSLFLLLVVVVTYRQALDRLLRDLKTDAS
jgi:hypothetical protein